MTAYQADGRPKMQLHDPLGLTNATSFHTTEFFVIDGPQVNLDPNFAVMRFDSHYNALSEYYESRHDILNWWTRQWTALGSRYALWTLPAQDITKSAKAFWLDDFQNFSSTDSVLTVCLSNTTYNALGSTRGLTFPDFPHVPLVTSVIRLNGTPFFLDDPALTFDFRSHQPPIFIIADNATSTRRHFTVDQLRGLGQCFPSGTYPWGFSTTLLFPFTVWTMLTWILTMVLRSNGRLRSRSYRYKVASNRYRDNLDLATELRQGREVGIVESMSARELDKIVKHDLNLVRLELPATS
ncbi:hypothetical protein LTR95_016414 [Oleoguttula sp. CCFEE 5521]